MAIEREAKVKVDSHDPCRDYLRQLGATPHGQHLELNTFFDTTDQSLLAAGKGLRVRINRDVASGQSEAILTYKGPLQSGPYKSREELETRIEDADRFISILQAIGLRAVLSFEKKRESWVLDDCKVELDQVSRLGWFIEVEGPSEKSIEAVLRKLHLDDLPLLRQGYASLLIELLPKSQEANCRAIFFPHGSSD